MVRIIHQPHVASAIIFLKTYNFLNGKGSKNWNRAKKWISEKKQPQRY